MARYTGLEARFGNVSSLTGPYNIELIGQNEDFEVIGRGETVNIPAIGNNYFDSITAGRVQPSVRMRFHPQNTSYLHNYLIVQTGNNISTHVIGYYANSADYGLLVNALPRSVELNFAKNSPLSVNADVYGTNWTTGLQTSTGNFSKAISSTEPLMSEQVTSVRLLDGAVEIRDFTDMWRRGNFQIDYGTEHVFTGTPINPSDVLEGVREVRWMLEVSVNDSAKLLPYTTNGSVLNFEVGFQVAPMSSCYTIYSSVIRVATVRVPGIDVQRQRIEGTGKYVTRSSLQ